MNVTVACITAFSISIAIIVAALITSIVFKQLKNRGENVKKHTFFTPFNIFLLGFFLSSASMAYPVFCYGQFSTDTGFIRIFKSLMISVLNSLQMFFLNADFSTVKEAISSSPDVQTDIAAVYTTYFSILYAVAPFLTFGFVLSFFKDFLARLKYRLHLPADQYVLSEINERSLALARDIFKNGSKGSKLVIFANAGNEFSDSEKEKKQELIDEAKRLGAVCLKKSITEIRLKRASKRHTVKFYLIGDDEDRNLKQSLELIGRCKSTKGYNNYNTQFFVFANSTESEVFLNSIDNGAMKVRRITQYWNTMLNTLRTHSIFKDAVQSGKEKKINLLVVGMGNYGTELVKMACWLGQMPKYKVHIHVFDKGNVKEKFADIAPELIAMNGNKQVEGEPYYNIHFHDKVDVNSRKFCEKLGKIGQVTSAFVALGNDELNVEIAVKLRTLFGRANIKLGNKIPPIYTIVFNSVKSDIFKKYGGLKGIDGGDYNIEIIDGVNSHFTLEVIEREELESEGLRCHLKWATTAKDVEIAMGKYEKYEYFRKSSIAESAHKQAMIDLGIYKVDDNGKVSDEIAKYEHCRWNAFMRAEGYIFDENTKDDIAKTHNKLIPYKSLDEDDKIKDYKVKSQNND